MSFITDLFGAKKAADAQKKAAQAAEQAAAASLAEQQRQYDQTRADYQPYLQTGTAALGRLNALSTGDMSSFVASPDYQFRLKEGERAMTARNALLGIQDSGAATKAALKYGQDVASSEYGNFWNRQAGLAGVGQSATGSVSNAGQNLANQTTGINQNKASALGSSYINQGNIWGNYLSNLGGQVDRIALKAFGL